MDWRHLAARLADEVAGPGSRWHPVISSVPRHILVPRWWETQPQGAEPRTWRLREGRADEDAWGEAAYRNRSLVTAVGSLHADHADPGDTPTGEHSSSSAMLSLVLRMIRHARLADGVRTLIVGTGSGYPTALLARRYGDDHVVSVDIHPYLTRAATERLAAFGLHPSLRTLDAHRPLPGTFDAIISMTGVRPVPLSWLRALRPGGRLVTTLAGTHLLLTAVKDTDGLAAHGRIEHDRSHFTPAATLDNSAPTQTGPRVEDPFARSDFCQVPSLGRYPLTRIRTGSELASLLELHSPGIRHRYAETADGHRTATLAHPDGSHAHADAHGDEPPAITQAGPRRLWDLLDDIRQDWITRGGNPVYGARAVIGDDGVIHLTNKDWTLTVR
ncbi:protein-L-isoaspartate O-methyltransferase family protein [Nonomuraea sp. NPDC004297]